MRRGTDALEALPLTQAASKHDFRAKKGMFVSYVIEYLEQKNELTLFH